MNAFSGIFPTMEALPTLYEHYTSGGITSGLSTNQPYFTLNNRNITIYSGSIHYFRVPRPYWRDRLRKMRAAGLNTIDTYIPWNLHEPKSGHYDFGNGGSDFEDFLDVKEFLNTVKEEDLFAIVRPGPYICAEWEFGGFPSWLLREKNIKLRSSQGTFMKYVARYFSVLLPILAMFQFLKGGPIIAFQIENEYGTTLMNDKVYLRKLRDLMTELKLVELFITSDSNREYGQKGTLPGEIFQTGNVNSDILTEFKVLEKFQPGKPLLLMEYYMGWFTHWGEPPQIIPCETVCRRYEEILKYNASVNIYMFHGGTNFGFMNGANMFTWNDYKPDITSYDYDAPLTERGEYTAKYRKIKELLNRYNPVKTRIPEMPEVKSAVAFPKIEIISYLPIYDLINKAREKYYSENVVPMETLMMNNDSGQSYGYIVYRKICPIINVSSTLTISDYVRDTVMVLLNGILVSKHLKSVDDLDGFGYWKTKNSNFTLTHRKLENVTLDLIVENWGRVNFEKLNLFKQFKGLIGDVFLNSVKLINWEVIPLEFKKNWTNTLVDWKFFQRKKSGPILYESVLDIKEPQDTYVDMGKWVKGIVIINGFVLGRYAKIGPQRCLYLPAPLLKQGWNTITIFEHFYSSKEIVFSNKVLYYPGTFQTTKEAQSKSEENTVQTEQSDIANGTYWSIVIFMFLINYAALVIFCIIYKRRRARL